MPGPGAPELGVEAPSQEDAPQNVPDMQVVPVDLDHLTFNTRGAQSQVHLQTRKPETGGPARLGPQFLTPDSRLGLPLPLIPGLLVGSLER